MYKRHMEKILRKWLPAKEIIILYGARQVGKTTLARELLKDISQSLIINCENTSVASVLESRDLQAIKVLFGPNRTVVLDEAQTLDNIGAILKNIYDELPEYKIIATGSSSFDLSAKVTESLTGRNLKFSLYPLSVDELKQKNGWLYVLESLKELMIYGMYPGVVIMESWQKQKKVTELASDYLFKDLLTFEKVKDSSSIRKMLRALALQVGNQVSVNELSNLTGLSRPMVEKYLDLLEKCFIIFRLESFSSNLRNEIKKSNKYYFIDNGIMNALTGNFNPLSNRTDTGILWENFVISEIVKQYNNQQLGANYYFWRTYDGAEIDLVIEINQELHAFEIKWSPKRKAKLPESFKNRYNVQDLIIINPNNFHILFDLIKK
ncbi:MAG: ATP-binding protein [Bacteroidetes bacterium]|nr:MAG: ATP-binding protein [Bacteroidota bacterium]